MALSMIELFPFQPNQLIHLFKKKTPLSHPLLHNHHYDKPIQHQRSNSTTPEWTKSHSHEEVRLPPLPPKQEGQEAEAQGTFSSVVFV